MAAKQGSRESSGGDLAVNLPHIHPFPACAEGSSKLEWGASALHVCEIDLFLRQLASPGWLCLGFSARDSSTFKLSALCNQPNNNLGDWSAISVRNAPRSPPLSIWLVWVPDPAQDDGPGRGSLPVPGDDIQPSELFRHAPESANWEPHSRDFPGIHWKAGPGPNCCPRGELETADIGPKATANAKDSIAWGTHIVGGVTPGRTTEHLGLPVLPTVRSVCAARPLLTPGVGQS
jgi:hypothetical protein